MSDTLVSNNIAYKGNIKVQILKNHKVTREKTFTNNGRWPLFSHIVNCLAGQYIEGEKNRPLTLGIYSIPYDDTQTEPGGTEKGYVPTIVDGSTVDKEKIDYYATSSNYCLGTPGMFMISPEPYVKKDNKGYAQVTYKFLIPFTSLKVSKLKENDPWRSKGYSVTPFNLVCLYGAQNSLTESKSEDETYGNPSAYFFVTGPNNTDLLSSFTFARLLQKLYTKKSWEFPASGTAGY